jgi:plastocyanin
MKVLIMLALMLVPTAASAADAAHTIVQKDRHFHPDEVTVNRGESLTFTNDDDFIHQIYVKSPDFSFDSAERYPGQFITETFTRQGTFEVRCHIHPKMLLTVHVR